MLHPVVPKKRVIKHERRNRTKYEITISQYLISQPLIFFSDLLFFFFSKVILDVEHLSNLLWCLSFNHVCYSFTANIQESFNVQIIGCQDDFKQCILVNIEKFLIPGRDVIRSFFFFVILIFMGLGWIFSVLCCPFNYL